MPEIGEKAPSFTLPQDGGDPVSLSDLAGAPVVLFFYPRDNTPGCTNEAIAFTGLLPEFEKAGAKVFGISKDSIKKHENFRAKHGLEVGLLSDADSTMCEDYGVWVEKKMYGKTHLGIERSTYVVAADGTIAKVWRKVKVPGHAEEVLETVQAL